MATELSSNWKKLQATLKIHSESASAAKKKKRKAELSEQQINSIAKKRRLESKHAASKIQSRGEVKMDAEQSTTDADQEDPQAKSAALALWAEENDISAKTLAEAYGTGLVHANMSRGEDVVNGGQCEGVEIGRYVGMDCEMVGVGGAEDRSVLARVSVVNFHGNQVYDSFVRPKEFVTDWRTHVSGVSPKNMPTARSLEQVQLVVEAILKDRILVGHAVENDLTALMLTHPKRDIRDTQRFLGFRRFGRKPRLQTLAKEILGVDIQGGQHSSIEDARATMLLFRRYKSEFDLDHAQRYPSHITRSNHSTKLKKGKKAKRCKVNAPLLN